ncbi:hypothetical protein Mterra_03069 [Calidithermus terrae]|uniref:Uncharacterized protein n=1 Tax=Calidithermus terrae TaxID=1408545 RepID=A0A399EDI1_9DEIN|nr:hypothetical protein [Calidithermus terrae]RIH81593.1 hypothetical protein Mterra_03069 [Calidithermus terrae]
MSKLRWSELEAAIPLGELPAFHRAFLALHRPELQAQALPLRRVQQYVTQTLHTLAKQGLARPAEGDFELEAQALPEPYRSRFSG